MNLERRPSRLFMQLSVLLPTLALSFGLLALGMSPIPRLLVSVGFGMVMIVTMYLWQRRRGRMRLIGRFFPGALAPRSRSRAPVTSP